MDKELQREWSLYKNQMLLPMYLHTKRS